MRKKKERMERVMELSQPTRVPTCIPTPKKLITRKRTRKMLQLSLPGFHWRYIIEKKRDNTKEGRTRWEDMAFQRFQPVVPGSVWDIRG
jgi:hypothetical protein